MITNADTIHLPFADKSVDLVFGSPPYCEARTYGKVGIERKRDPWVLWMLNTNPECMRVRRGAVILVVAGTGNYETTCERLMIQVEDQYHAHVLRQCIWTANKVPTGSRWYSNGWEYVLAFADKYPLTYFDVSEITTPLKYGTGDHLRQRGKAGTSKRGRDYTTHAKRKRMPNIVHVTVSGGHMGHELACENKAPLPEKLAEYFVRSLYPTGGTVLDPFCGPGTTKAMDERFGRAGIGTDLRVSQYELTQRWCNRLRTDTTHRRKNSDTVAQH